MGPRRVKPVAPDAPTFTPLPDTRIEDDCEVRRIQPYQATKTYLCPGCQQTIPARTGHLVVVPIGAPEDRRHWHRSCWAMRARRGPTGR
jgi:hypothetical protein